MSNSREDSAEKEPVSKVSDESVAEGECSADHAQLPRSLSDYDDESIGEILAEVSSCSQESKKSRGIFTRRRFLKLAGGVTLSGAACVAYAFEVEPDRLKVKHVELEIAGLPPGCDGLKVAQLTDLHFETGEDEELMEKVMTELRQLAPDLIFYTGDYISENMDSFEGMMHYLKQVEASQGMFAISGNHDVWYGDREVMRRQFEAAGVSYLCNEWTRLNIRGESLFISGLDSVWGGAPDILRPSPVFLEVLLLSLSCMNLIFSIR